MNCKQCQRLLEDHLDGILAGDKSEPGANANANVVSAHLEHCGACREQLAQVRRDVALLRAALAPLRLQEGLRADVLAAIEAGKSASPVSVRGVVLQEMDALARKLVPIAAAALFALCLVLPWSGGSGANGLRGNGLFGNAGHANANANANANDTRLASDTSWLLSALSEEAELPPDVAAIWTLALPEAQTRTKSP